MTVWTRELYHNFRQFGVGDVTFWFSYETCVAFHSSATGMVVSENIWSRTTGKHLNMISDKEDRVPYDEFEQKLAEVSKQM